ncbi:MAG: TolB family protein [Salinivenus sp.]
MFASCALWAGCSSSESTTSDSGADDSGPADGPALSLLYATDGGALIHHDARTADSDTLASGVQADGAQAVSPSERYLAFSYATADSSRLALLDLKNGDLHPVHARAESDVYSLAWHPEDDRLAFGVYESQDDGARGPGSIQVAEPNDAPRNVGCSSAREVLAWLPSDILAARNDDQLYTISPSDCATESSSDARRMHEATYASGGSRLAYIHRELAYDSDAGEYTPDSSLYLSDAQGENATEVLSSDRRPRHLRWSPDGSELALDAHTEKSGQRQVVVYSEADDRTVYLTPPSDATNDQTHPRWSPDGTHVAFTQGRGADARAAVRIEGQTRTLGPVDGAVWGWTDEQTVVVPGPDSVRAQTIDGTTRYAHPSPATLIHVWEQSPS